MIQRIQTVWLLLAAIAAFLFTQLPLFSGTLAGETLQRFMPTENLLLFALGIALALLAFDAIFLFKNRALQSRLAVFGIIGSIALIALEVWQIEVFKEKNPLLKGNYSWGSLIPIVLFIFFIMALKNIRKDEKLIKSLDRLR